MPLCVPHVEQSCKVMSRAGCPHACNSLLLSALCVTPVCFWVNNSKQNEHCRIWATIPNSGFQLQAILTNQRSVPVQCLVMPSAVALSGQCIALLENAAACAGSLSGSQPTHAAEHGPDRTPPGSQQSLRAHSSQEGYGCEGQPDNQGEGVGRQQPGGEGEGLQSHHSDAEQQPTSQRPQERQHQSLAGNSVCSM